MVPDFHKERHNASDVGTIILVLYTTLILTLQLWVRRNAVRTFNMQNRVGGWAKTLVVQHAVEVRCSDEKCGSEKGRGPIGNGVRSGSVPRAAGVHLSLRRSR